MHDLIQGGVQEVTHTYTERSLQVAVLWSLAPNISPQYPPIKAIALADSGMERSKQLDV